MSPTSRRARARRIAVVLGAVALSVAVCWAWNKRPGAIVTVRNNGLDEVVNVRVRTRGMEFDIGEIPYGESRSASVTAVGTSGVEVQWTYRGRGWTDSACNDDVQFTGMRDGVPNDCAEYELEIGVSSWPFDAAKCDGIAWLPPHSLTEPHRPR